MASPEFDTIVAYLRENLALADPNLSAEDLRASMAAGTGAMPAPDGIAFEPTTAAGVPALWVRPDGARDDAAVLYLHGGGYVIGSPETHRGITGRLAALTGCPVLSLDYRLAPEHPHPAAVTDSVAAYRWLLDRGLAPEQVAIAGDSAGGGLTFASLLKLRDDGVPLPACGVGISPWTDLQCSSASMQRLADVDPMCKPAGLMRMAQWFVGDGDVRDPYVSPLFGDLHDLPPLLVHVGEVETLLDDAVHFAERAQAAGVDVTLEVFPEMVHVFHAFVGLVPESDAACETVAAFLRKHMSI
jgi:monoterpene epsilon-lactone hydrolase